jgi:hypothetical protein
MSGRVLSISFMAMADAGTRALHVWRGGMSVYLTGSFEYLFNE